MTATAAEMAAEVEIVLTVVVNAEQTRAVLFGDNGLLPGLKPGSVVISCATCAPDAVQALGADLAAHDIHLLDAPISGGSVKAAAGQLTIMASGPAALFDQRVHMRKLCVQQVKGRRLADTQPI